MLELSCSQAFDYRRTDGQTDRQTDRRTDGQTDRHYDYNTPRCRGVKTQFISPKLAMRDPKFSRPSKGTAPNIESHCVQR